MLIAAGMDPRLSLAQVGGYARRVETLGFDALHVPETIHDPFVVAGLAIAATERLRVRTAVALAFIRSPMLTALTSWSLAEASGGRFDLGLGTQIRANIEDRYGAAFDPPVDRLRSHVAAVLACFSAFATGEPLDHHDDFHDLTRLQPEFRPDPLGATRSPDVWLGAVGTRMVALAGEVADGLLTHPTASHPDDLLERVLPAMVAGAARGRRAVPPMIVAPLVATGIDDAAVAGARRAARQRLGFLYSTPAYRPTLERLGHPGLGGRLRAAARNRRWDDLGTLLPDDLVAEIVPTATWDDLADVLVRWYGGFAAGLLLRPPRYADHDDAFGRLIGDLRSSTVQADAEPFR